MCPDNEVTPTPEFDNAKSTRTRADVKAELEQSRAAGQQPGAGEVTPTPDIDKAKSTRTRDEVRKELDDYVKSGQRDSDRNETQAGG